MSKGTNFIYMFLYEIINKIDGMKYVGITKGRVKHRWWSHKKDLKTGKHGNYFLQRAYNKYGPDAFEYKVRMRCSSLEELSELEKSIIKEEKENLYNIKKGGYDAPFAKHSEETKRKIGEASKIAVVGMSIETGEIREYSCSKDTALHGFHYKNIGKCCRLSISKSGNRPPRQAISTGKWVWMYKSEFNIEEMNRRADMARKRGNNDQSRPIIGKSLIDGSIVRFRSCTEASKSFPVKCTGIRGACLWKQSKSAVKHVWVFEDEAEPTILLEKRYKYAMKTFNGQKVIGPRSKRSNIKKV